MLWKKSSLALWVVYVSSALSALYVYAHRQLNISSVSWFSCSSLERIWTQDSTLETWSFWDNMWHLWLFYYHSSLGSFLLHSTLFYPYYLFHVFLWGFWSFLLNSWHCWQFPFQVSVFLCFLSFTLLLLVCAFHILCNFKDYPFSIGCKHPDSSL